MSSIKTEESLSLKSSKDILNELFGSFNTSFDEESSIEQDSNKKKKKKKKSKGNDEDDEEQSDGGHSNNKKHHKKKSKKRRRSRSGSEGSSKGGGEDDVDKLIKKHRRNVKNQFKGLVSSIGDIVIKNDELIKSKSKKREDEIKRAASSSSSVPMDVEDGEILEGMNNPFDGSHTKSKKKQKLSASQAYKLDLEEKVLLDIEKNRDHRDVKQHKSSSKSKSVLSSSKHSSEHYSSKENANHHRHHHHHPHKDDILPTPVSVRHAPPRDATSPPQEPADHYHSSRKSYTNYKDTYWQKERDHYEPERDYNSRRRERDYDVDKYYEKEAGRRNDGRTGFGFSGRSYYDEAVDHGDKRHHHHSQHDDRYKRGRSRSPKTRSHSHHRRSRSRSPPPQRWRRSRSRSRERRSHHRHPDDIIDKTKLLEIARKNAAKLMRRGCLPTDIFSRDQIMAIRAGGKSVDELTEYCKRLARKDARGDAISEDDDEEGGQFVHHPFHVKDKPLPQITLNIRNSIPIPVRTPQELAIEGAKLKTAFPVSSGCQHRIKELEWHPVDPEEEAKKAKAAADEANSKAIVPLDGSNVNIVSPMVRKTDKPEKSDASPEKPIEKKPDICLDKSNPPNFDISDVIAIRLKAMRQLSENPKSDDAKKQLEDATKMMKTWADSKALEPKFLTQSELTQGPQAWAKRDQLTKAKEVQSRMGLHLLQKMGWKPGEGLGKCKSGDIEPLALEVKTDKKGLTSVLDYKKGPALPLVYDLSGKHPISALMELCAKRKWGAPDFDLVFEHGPPHQKQFVYKVVVNGVEYQPCVAVNNKKLAKANAAAFCLQSLGLLPTSQLQESTETLQTVPQPVPPPGAPQQPTPPPPCVPTYNNPNTTPIGRFTPSSQYLQTVPSQIGPTQPPLPPSALMPPPPPPPAR